MRSAAAAWPLLALLAALAGCAGAYAPLEKIEGEDPDDTETPDDSAVADLHPPVRPALSDPARFLRRAALDITGHLPSPEALSRVSADPASLDAELAALLEHPGVAERMVHVLDERWHVRYEAIPVGPSDFGFEESRRYELARSVTEEPLRWMAHVITEDLSWDRILDSDTTMAVPLLAEVWPLEIVGEANTDGWAPARWTDHRPEAGVLASNGLWWRYATTAFNYNRTRAAAATRLLVCHDFLETVVEFESPSLVDEEGTAAAIRENPSCVACHGALDPIAAAMFGFWAFELYDPLELSHYHPEREPLGEELLQHSPAWFGTPVEGLAELAPTIAADRRFPRCAVDTFANAMWRRGTQTEDSELIGDLTDIFEADGRRVKPLLLHLTATEAYVGNLAASPPPGAHDRFLGPQQLSAVLRETVGFTWTYSGENQLDSDVTGLRVALGGVDGEEVTSPKRSVDANLVLAWRAAAEAAARHALADLAVADCALLPGADLNTRPGDAAFDASLAYATTWLTGQPADAPTLDALTGLWLVAGEGDPAEGWATVLSALFQDPAFVTY